MIMSSRLLQSLRIVCSFTVFPKSQCLNRSPQLPTLPIQQLPQCNRLQILLFSTVVAIMLCEFENFAVSGDVIKRICTNFKNFIKFAIFFKTNFKHRRHEFSIYGENAGRVRVYFDPLKYHILSFKTVV